MKRTKNLGGRLYLLLLLVIVLVPFYWMVATSLKSDAEVAMTPSTLYPHSVHLDNYLKALQGSAVPALFPQYGHRSRCRGLHQRCCQHFGCFCLRQAWNSPVGICCFS